MDTQILAGAGIIALLLLTTVGATQTNIDDPVTRQIPVENNPLADNKPEITNLHPPDGAENLSANPEISFRVQDVDTETLDVVILKDQQSEVIFNEEVESGDFVEIPANNTTLGDNYNKDYSWTVEVSDETSQVQKNLEFSTMNPFTDSPRHTLGDAQTVLDYSGTDVRYREDCSEYKNQTTCLYTHTGNKQKISYDNSLYLLESNQFNISYQARSSYWKDIATDTFKRGTNTKITFSNGNGSAISFKKNLGNSGYNADWEFTFVEQSDDDNYAISWENEAGTKVKTVDFDKHDEIYWTIETGKMDIGAYNRETYLRLYEWDTDMATLKDDVDESFLSTLMSVF